MTARPIIRDKVVAMLWPVYAQKGHFDREYIAWFLDRWSAEDFVNATTDRELYIGTPRYDHLPRVSEQLTECLPDPLKDLAA